MYYLGHIDYISRDWKDELEYYLHVIQAKK